MSVALTGTAGWGTRFGACAYVATQVDAYRNLASDAQASAIYKNFQTNEQLSVGSLYSNELTYKSVHAQWLQSVQQLVQSFTIAQVNRDTPLSQQTVTAALTVFAAQLRANGSNIQRPTVTLTPASGASNVGDAVLVASAADPSDGGQFDYALSETINVSVSQDAAAGATQYSEVTTAAGAPIADPFAAGAWPGGSGAAAQLTCVDGEKNTLVTDGGFESWTGSTTPNNWTIVTGAATVSKGSSPLRGAANLVITSDGATQTRLRSTQLTSPQPLTAYACNLWGKISATAVGTITVKLVDGSGNTINDAAGNANSFTIDTSTGLTTSYKAFNGFFRLPRNLPTQVFLDIHLTSVPTSGRVIQIDTLALVTAQQLYAGGPYAGLFSGGTAVVRGDAWTLIVSNSHTAANMSRSLDRFFSLRSLGIKFPSTVAGFVAMPDSLIAQG